MHLKLNIINLLLLEAMFVFSENKSSSHLADIISVIAPSRLLSIQQHDLVGNLEMTIDNHELSHAVKGECCPRAKRERAV